MDPEFWLETWAAGRIGFHLDRVNPWLQRYWPELAIPAGATVFVPLSGKSLDLVHLRDQGHPVLGCELSPIAIGQFFGEQGQTPLEARIGALPVFEAAGIRLIQGDFFALHPADLPPLAAVYDRAALIAMPPERQADYVRQLLTLAPAAPILLITFDFDPAELAGPPFATPPAQVERLFGGTHRIECRLDVDALTSQPGLAQRGLTSLREMVWILRPL